MTDDGLMVGVFKKIWFRQSSVDNMVFPNDLAPHKLTSRHHTLLWPLCRCHGSCVVTLLPMGLWVRGLPVGFCENNHRKQLMHKCKTKKRRCFAYHIQANKNMNKWIKIYFNPHSKTYFAEHYSHTYLKSEY